MPTADLKKLFGIFLTVSTVALLWLGIIDLGLRNPITPHGIISFELCAYTSSCQSAMVGWGFSGQLLAMLSLGADYLYMLTYPGVIWSGLLLVEPRVPDALKPLTRFAAWFAWGAGIADACENFCLIEIIVHQDVGKFGTWASGFATIKFGIFGLTALWLLFTSVRYVLLKRQGHSA